MNEGSGHPGPFKGRSISVVHDLTLDEQLYLYGKTAQLKESWNKPASLEPFRIQDTSLAMYLMFLEDSTRTKESFRNAGVFHGISVNNFEHQASSFNKQESFSDTVKMLAGYNRQSIFVLRTKQEGVCRHLEEYVGKYCERMGIEQPAFINAGDGKHEHPTQEFLDEFSFLEQMKSNRDSVHIALTGDLFHGRTVHSKADGLQIFRNVKVDLIAPEELALPPFYLRKMKSNGFEVRLFYSMEEYLSQKDIAPIWYFTRLQLERMGDKILDKEAEFRNSLTFRQEYLRKLPENTRFYHPLPQNRMYPTIPRFVWDTPLNGWDSQSINGYLVRIGLLGMVSGHWGHDFQGESKSSSTEEEEYITEAVIKHAPKNVDYKTGIKPVDNGIVIDHIGRGCAIEEVWKLIDKIRRNLDLNYLSSHGVFEGAAEGSVKGLISLPNVLEMDDRKMKMLAALSPGCTINIIKNHTILKKYRLGVPPRIFNFQEASCRNDNCISHPDQFEPVTAEFLRSNDKVFVCKYCEKPHEYQDIWVD